MTVERDKQGYLLNLSDWNKDLARTLASEEGIELTDAHWDVIDVLRNFYTEYQISPAMRVFVKLCREKLGEEKGNSIYLLSLFPDSPAKLASKIAGLPKPTNCL